MKKVLVIATIALFTAVALTSCTAGARSSKGGCHASQGFVGYGR